MALIITSYLMVSLMICLFVYWKWKQSYWKRMNLEFQEPHLLFGNFKDSFTKTLSLNEQFQKIYNEFKSRGLKHGGIYILCKPVYVPVDLDVINCILRNDFDNFMNRGLFCLDEKADPLSASVINLEDDKWKTLRNKLGPLFSPGKMRMMFRNVVSCADDLRYVLENHSITEEAIDVREVISCFTMDIIGSTTFGLDQDSLRNPDSEFKKWGRRYFEPSWSKTLKMIIWSVIPRKILITMGLKQTGRAIEEFIMNMVKNTVQHRETNNVSREDFMHFLLQLKNRGKVSEDGLIFEKGAEKESRPTLSLNSLAAQCFAFFLAGFETSATTMTFALLELAINQDVQEKLRYEINTVLKKHNGQVCYDAIMEMCYLDKVVNESLRKHPPLPYLPRICKQSYKVPGTNFVLPAGTSIDIPFTAIQRDPEYYPEPDKFDPERFSEENKAKRHPLAFMPFGQGPRICLGARFGLLQTKVGLATIVRSFKLTLNEKTQMPIKYSTNTFFLDADGGVWINVEKID